MSGDPGLPLTQANAYRHAVERLRRALAAGSLPGRDAMRTVEPSGRGFVAPEAARELGSRLGAALVFLYPVEGVPHVVLTLRRPDLKDHAGQVSLPGGRVEPGETVRDAALREAWEEVAIPRAAVHVLGALTPVYIPPTRFLLHPTVAAGAARPDFRVQASEVAEIIEAPVAAFVGGAARREETWEIRGERRRVPFYAIGPHKVWGATAMVLAELAAVWAAVGADAPAGAASSTPSGAGRTVGRQ